MSLKKFADELREVKPEMSTVATQELTRIKQLLKQKALNGFTEFEIFEIEHGRDDRLGTVNPQVGSSNDKRTEHAGLDGPVHEVIRELKNEGLEIEYFRESRYSRSNKYGAFVVVVANWE